MVYSTSSTQISSVSYDKLTNGSSTSLSFTCEESSSTHSYCDIDIITFCPGTINKTRRNGAQQLAPVSPVEDESSKIEKAQNETVPEKRTWKDFFKDLRKCAYCCCNISYILCCPPIPYFIIRKSAFQPFKHKFYNFKVEGKVLKKCPRRPSITQLYSITFTPEHLEWRLTTTLPSSSTQYYYVRTSRGNHVACVLLFPSTRYTKVLLFSHSNAPDIGFHLIVFPGLQMWCDYLECAIVAYDYSGYGMSSGRPSESNLYADITAVYEDMVKRLSVPPERVVLWGNSLGTAPSVQLAMKEGRLCGLILTGTILSAMRCVFRCLDDDRQYRGCCDHFGNIHKASKVLVPTLIVHDRQDNLTDFEQIKRLHKRFPRAVEPLWLTGFGHNEILLSTECWSRMKRFIME